MRHHFTPSRYIHNFFFKCWQKCRGDLNGKEVEKEGDICIYVAYSFCCKVETTAGRRQWHPTPVLLPGKCHGQRSLVGFSPWGVNSRTRLSDFSFTFHFHALEKAVATHSSALAWRIPGTGEPGGLPSMGSHRVGHNWSDLAAYFGKKANLK